MEEIRLISNKLNYMTKMTQREKLLFFCGCLIALCGIEKNIFSIDNLTGEEKDTDGEKLYSAICDVINCFKNSNNKKLFTLFEFIKKDECLNEKNEQLNETKIKYFLELINDKIFEEIKNNYSFYNYIKKLYFLTYIKGGEDSKNLGIVLTENYITDLIVDILDIKPDDVIIEPCSGDGGFILSAMKKQYQKLKKENKTEKEILKSLNSNFYGIEIDDFMFCLLMTNMILYNSKNFLNCDFLKLDSEEIKNTIKPTIGIINPPYSLGSKENPELYELNFVKKLIDCITPGGKVAALISNFSLKTNKYTEFLKSEILKKHTLEGVITLSKNSFKHAGVQPVVAIFTAGIPHPKNKLCKFIDFRNDGVEVIPHVGILETQLFENKKKYLLEVWKDNIQAEEYFCLKSAITHKDEWLISSLNQNCEIPNEEYFEEKIGDYLLFKFSMILKNKEHIFESEVNEND